MKKIFALLCITAFTMNYAQVAIGKDTVEGSSALLDFGTTNRAIILPWVTKSADVQSPAKGTLIYDVFDKKIKIFNGTSWQDLSKVAGSMSATPESHSRNEIGNGVQFGDDNSGATGVLVLDDATKTIILPKATEPHKTLNPEPGTMVYDTVNKVICLYDGTQWTFWGN